MMSDRTLGTVYASSGWRTVAHNRFTPEEIQKWKTVHGSTQAGKALKTPMSQIGWCVDWALIDVSPPRQMSNFVPEGNASIKLAHAAMSDYYITINPEERYDVAKFGRTSGGTTGEINRTASYLSLRPGDPSSIVPVDLTHRFKHVGLACGIISSTKEKDVIASGDSGSVVLLNQATGVSAYIVGLGFASNTATMVSYMAPFDLIIEDIKRVTGAKGFQPAWAGEVSSEEPGSP